MKRKLMAQKAIVVQKRKRKLMKKVKKKQKRKKNLKRHLVVEIVE